MASFFNSVDQFSSENYGRAIKTNFPVSILTFQSGDLIPRIHLDINDQYIDQCQRERRFRCNDQTRVVCLWSCEWSEEAVRMGKTSPWVCRENKVVVFGLSCIVVALHS